MESSGDGRAVDIASARDEAHTAIYADLARECPAIVRAANAVRAEHTTLVTEIAGRLRNVGRTGADSADAAGGGAASGGQSPMLVEARRIIDNYLVDVPDHLINYQHYQQRQFTPDRALDKQADMERGADERARSLSEEAQVQLWTEELLGRPARRSALRPAPPRPMSRRAKART